MPNRRDAKSVVVFTGVDWISGTLGRDEDNDQVWLNENMQALWKVQALGNVLKRRSLLGFDGWETGGCFVGSNETMHYAQFAGKYANDAYRTLDHKHVHISRIDLQLTVQYDIELVKEGRFQYARAINHNKSLPKHRQRTIHLYAGSDGADTIYVGAPSSDLRGRIYNKDKQSADADYKWCWRYEVVYRNDYAFRMYRLVISSAAEASAVICTQVIDWYSERGVNILDVARRSERTLEPLKAPKTDVARKLRWIKNQVVPTIRKLAELGYAEELMDLISEAIAAARNELN